MGNFLYNLALEFGHPDTSLYLQSSFWQPFGRLFSFRRYRPLLQNTPPLELYSFQMIPNLPKIDTKLAEGLVSCFEVLVMRGMCFSSKEKCFAVSWSFGDNANKLDGLNSLCFAYGWGRY